MAGSKEDAKTVTAFCQDLRARGLGDPRSTSDGAPGIVKAIETDLPRSERRRRLAHRMRNLAAKVPEDVWPELKARATACYQAPARAIARELAQGVVADFEAELPSAVACFMDDFEACIAHLRMPVSHRGAIGTTNRLERLFLQERRRLRIIPNAFGEKPVLKLMFGAMIRAAARWRALKVTDFERRRIAALGRELNHEYEARNGLAKTPSADASRTKLSSTSRTWPFFLPLGGYWLAILAAFHPQSLWVLLICALALVLVAAVVVGKFGIDYKSPVKTASGYKRPIGSGQSVTALPPVQTSICS